VFFYLGFELISIFRPVLFSVLNAIDWFKKVPRMFSRFLGKKTNNLVFRPHYWLDSWISKRHIVWRDRWCVVCIFFLKRNYGGQHIFGPIKLKKIKDLRSGFFLIRSSAKLGLSGPTEPDLILFFFNFFLY